MPFVLPFMHEFDHALIFSCKLYLCTGINNKLHFSDNTLHWISIHGSQTLWSNSELTDDTKHASTSHRHENSAVGDGAHTDD